jgi:hypothetical protein
MKKIKLTDQQKNDLFKPNLYLEATFGEGLTWHLSVNNEEGFYFEDFYPTPGGRGGHQRSYELKEVEDTPGFKLIEETAEEIVRSLEDEIYDSMYCDECNGYGGVNINYDPETQTFSCDIEVYLILSEETEHMKTFEEWANTQPMYPWQTFTYLKKLLDPEFIEKYKNEADNGIFELIYNGGGDSGQFDEPIDIPRDIEYLGYEIIDVYHSGWENNEGADGTIIINFNEKTISIYHSQNYEDTESVDLGKFQFV